VTTAIEGLGIGIDAVEVPRFRKALERRPGLRERLFTEGELTYAARFSDPAPRLAARFAVKEAAMKSLGVGLGAFRFRDVEVVRRPGGAPELAVAGLASELATRLDVTGWRVSITHTDLMAEAVVLALGVNP
jgi:phosphopantetheine--protein transferase-like protein